MSLGIIFVPVRLGSKPLRPDQSGHLSLLGSSDWRTKYVMYGVATVASAAVGLCAVEIASSSGHSNEHLNSFLSKSTFPSLKHHSWFYYF